MQKYEKEKNIWTHEGPIIYIKKNDEHVKVHANW